MSLSVVSPEMKCIPVVHHKKFKLADIVDNKFLKSIGEIVASLLVCAVTNVGHKNTSLELSPHT